MVVRSEIVLIGAFDASEKLNFFSDKDSGNNNGVDIVNASGADGTIKVYTQNGFLFATLTGKNQGQGVQLHVDQDKAFSVMSEASYPVVERIALLKTPLPPQRLQLLRLLRQVMRTSLALLLRLPTLRLSNN